MDLLTLRMAPGRLLSLFISALMSLDAVVPSGSAFIAGSLLSTNSLSSVRAFLLFSSSTSLPFLANGVNVGVSAARSVLARRGRGSVKLVGPSARYPLGNSEYNFGVRVTNFKRALVLGEADSVLGPSPGPEQSPFPGASRVRIISASGGGGGMGFNIVLVLGVEAWLAERELATVRELDS